MSHLKLLFSFSAQVHQYMTLSHDKDIQRIIEGLIRRQTQFIFANPYGSSFRLTLRANPPSDDSLQPIHVQKGRNIRVAMHNYELDSLCYFLRLSYTWWKQTQRADAFDRQWLLAVSIIVQVMVVEQHHSEISPYRYTELGNNYQGSRVSYTGMTWSAFRPSDDQTKFGYLIPSNMMAAVVLRQVTEMIKTIFPDQTELVKQVHLSIIKRKSIIRKPAPFRSINCMQIFCRVFTHMELFSMLPMVKFMRMKPMDSLHLFFSTMPMYHRSCQAHILVSKHPMILMMKY